MVNLNWAQFEMLTVFYIYVSFAFKNPLSEDQIPSKKKKKKKIQNQVNFIFLHYDSNTSLYDNLETMNLSSVPSYTIFDI